MHKWYLIFFSACFLSMNIFAQDMKESFYKDITLKKETDEKSAKFKKVEKVDADGKRSILVYNVKRNCLLRDEYYLAGKPVGTWTSYDDKCMLLGQRNFNKLKYHRTDSISYYDNVSDGNDSTVYEKAAFLEGEAAFMTYLVKNINYPSEAKEVGISGTVYLKFLVHPNGRVEVLQIVRSADPFLDYSAWEVIESMSLWKPARCNGVEIASTFVLPIRYVLK
jgi:TonB family protein